MQRNQALGLYGERVAAAHLRSLGMVVLARNWRCRFGEIDLVARDGSTFVICEVKTRTSRSTARRSRPSSGARPPGCAGWRRTGSRSTTSSRRPCASRSCRWSSRHAARRTSSAWPGSPDGGHPRGDLDGLAGVRSRWRSTSAAACRPPSSSGSPTPSSTRRATGCGRRSSTRARPGPTSASRSTWRRRPSQERRHFDLAIARRSSPPSG